MERLHQEDLAQAAGVHPAVTYQNDGGPGIAQIAGLLREHLGRSAVPDLSRFFEATLFNWASLGTDAHAKNYAILYSPRRGTRPTLAPLYDLGSALAYPEISDRNARLAMSYAGHYRAREIQQSDIAREAEGIGLEAEWAITRARELASGLPEALSSAAAESHLGGGDATFAARLVDRARERSAALLAQL